MNSEKGFTLVEVIVGVAILSIVGIGLLSALGGASKVLLKADTRETARDLAQAQIEYVQNQDYKTDDPNGNLVFYNKIPDLGTNPSYSGYDVEIHAERVEVESGYGIADDTGIQKITIIVKKDSIEKFRLEGHKANWHAP